MLMISINFFILISFDPTLELSLTPSLDALLTDNFLHVWDSFLDFFELSCLPSNSYCIPQYPRREKLICVWNLLYNSTYIWYVYSRNKEVGDHRQLPLQLRIHWPW